MLDMIMAYALLASGSVANKYILRTMPADMLVGLRMSLSGLIILLFSVRNSPRLRWSHIRHDVKIIAVIAVVTTLIPALLKAFALSHMAASKQMLLGSVDPFITAGYAYLLWREPLTWRKLLGMLIGTLGIGVSLLSSTPAERLLGEWWYISLPEVAVLIAVALGRYGWIMTQIMLKQNRYQPHELTGISMFLGGLLALVTNIVRGGAFAMPKSNSWFFVSMVIYTIFIGNICGYTAYSYCLRRHSATTVALTGLLMPLFVAAIASFVGLERLTLHFFIAIALVAAGMALFYSDHLKSDSPAPIR